MSLSDYVEEKLLGRGSYGCVYCVRHNRIDKLLAMKQVRPGLSHKSKGRAPIQYMVGCTANGDMKYFGECRLL